MPLALHRRGAMNIDERLEKLAERHEALSQSLELMAHMHSELERDIRALTAAVATDAENIRALARIAEIRERRLTGLEG
jgi:hypothetical protein